MKLFVFAVCALAVFGTTNALPHDKKNPADTIKRIIDHLLDAIPAKLGIKDYGFIIPNNPFIKGTVNIDEISISGFKTPNIENITYEDGTSRIEYELNFEDVVTIIDYTIVVDGIIKINHHFSADIDLSNFDGKGHAIMSKDQKEITDFSIVIGIDKVKCDIIGFLNDDTLSKIISEAVTSFGAPLFDEIAAQFSPMASSIIKDIINFMLKIFSEQ